MDRINIAEYAKLEKQVPNGCIYIFKVNNQILTTAEECMTGEEILTLAGKTPANQFCLYKVKKGKSIEISLCDKVDFTEKGIERFRVKPKSITDGKGGGETLLPSSDVKFLDEIKYEWEVKVEKKIKWLIIRNFPIPEGYNHKQVDVALRIESNYPQVQIDMAYFNPGLSRLDGKAIPRVIEVQIDGVKWQRWSRHRQNANITWDPINDGVQTHLEMFVDVLKNDAIR